MAPTDKRKEPSMLAAVGLASGIGLQFAASVLVGLGLGLFIDHLAHTAPWFLLIGIVLGIVGGSYSVVRTALKEIRQ